MKVYGVAGWKNSGKTGLMERLVAEFVERGFSVSTIKHAHHAFDVDQPGKDSYRHRAAGASEVIIGSRARWALMAELREADEPSLGELLSKLSPVDLVLVEGFKGEMHAKIEAHRAETGAALLAPEDKSIKAIASNNGATFEGCAAFDLNDTGGIADFIQAELSL